MDKAKPLLVYDGDCGFCKIWIRNWRYLTGDHIDYAPSQAVAEQYSHIPPQAFEEAVQLIMPDGSYTSAADAVFHTLRYTAGYRWLYSLYRLPPVRWLTEAAYRFIATHRDAGYKITRLLWGDGPGPHSNRFIRWLFLRLLGFIYFIAFISFGQQVLGLVGTNGILPVSRFLEGAYASYGAEAYRLFPTVLWLNSGDSVLLLLSYGGALLALLLILRVAPSLMLVLLWFCYLSLVTAGQVFMRFQWDMLLLETGFLAIFLAPPTLRPQAIDRHEPSAFVIWAFRFLLFRLMFSSGAVKLLSGDPSWHGLTALSYHYETQPIPNPLAWYMHQLPSWFHSLSTLIMFIIELAIPFSYFMPRRLRAIGAIATIGLMLAIFLTGNFTFFNWLTIALCVLLLDDTMLARVIPARIKVHLGTMPPRPPRLQWGRILPVSLIVLLAFTRFASHMTQTIPPSPLREAIRLSAPYGIANHYGLFAIMTTERPTLVLEGSDDGETWREYVWRYQPQDVMQPPPVVAPFQPRLDWQAWFAALSTPERNRWLFGLVQRLLEGEAQVLALLGDNPFPDAPPQYVRVRLYQYRFTDWQTRAETGAWWTRTLIGDYLPPISAARQGG